MTEHRTLASIAVVDDEALVIDAFAQLGVDTQRVDGDLVVDPGGVAVRIEILRRSWISDPTAEHLFAERPRPGRTLLVVADRVTDAARKIVLARRGGYLDLRGRLAVRTDRLLIDADVTRVRPRVGRSGAVSGQAGLEVATALLLRPERPAVVRELARRVRRAPSTISEILAALRHEGLIDDGNAIVGSGLFRQVADRWTTERVYLANLPEPGGVADDPGWALTGRAAAADYGAPVTFDPEQALDFFVPDRATADRAIDLLGTTASAAQARATMRIAPVSAAAAPRFESLRLPSDWLLTHMLFVALDLATDSAQGREVLDSWSPAPGPARVW